MRRVDVHVDFIEITICHEAALAPRREPEPQVGSALIPSQLSTIVGAARGSRPEVRAGAS